MLATIVQSPHAVLLLQRGGDNNGPPSARNPPVACSPQMSFWTPADSFECDRYSGYPTSTKGVTTTLDVFEVTRPAIHDYCHDRFCVDSSANQAPMYGWAGQSQTRNVSRYLLVVVNSFQFSSNLVVSLKPDIFRRRR